MYCLDIEERKGDGGRERWHYRMDVGKDGVCVRSSPEKGREGRVDKRTLSFQQVFSHEQTSDPAKSIKSALHLCVCVVCEANHTAT